MCLITMLGFRAFRTSLPTAEPGGEDDGFLEESNLNTLIGASGVGTEVTEFWPGIWLKQENVMNIHIRFMGG